VATKDDPEEYEKLLSCLDEGNRVWAKNAWVLALGCISERFALNDKKNPVARHDLGQASAVLTVEATSRGLHVHQMLGILPDRAREVYAIPEGYRVLTGLAIGYLGTAGEGPLAERDATPRTRHPLSEYMFKGSFGKAYV
jgi:hypothetical protein